MSMMMLHVHVDAACPCPCRMSMSLLHVQSGDTFNLDGDYKKNILVTTNFTSNFFWGRACR
jgi:hypothetical protein